MNAALIMSFKHGTASKHFRTLLEISAPSRPPIALYTFVPCNHHEHFRFFLAVYFVHILMIFSERYMASLCTEWRASVLVENGNAEAIYS